MVDYHPKDKDSHPVSPGWSPISRGGKSVATWQPSYQKVFEESVFGRNFLILLLHFLISKQFGEKVKEIISVYLENGHIFDPFLNNIPKMQKKINCRYLKALL